MTEDLYSVLDILLHSRDADERDIVEEYVVTGLHAVHSLLDGSAACERGVGVVVDLSDTVVDGDAVLLSPAGPAFDKFKNFMVRGQEFKKTVMAL